MKVSGGNVASVFKDAMDMAQSSLLLCRQGDKIREGLRRKDRSPCCSCHGDNQQHPETRGRDGHARESCQASTAQRLGGGVLLFVFLGVVHRPVERRFASCMACRPACLLSQANLDCSPMAHMCNSVGTNPAAKADKNSSTQERCHPPRDL
jgi:hypothetical protein